MTSRTLSTVSALLLLASAVGARAGGGLGIDWYTVDSGGGSSSGAGLEVRGTIGQPDAGRSTGAHLSLTGGFWAAEPGTAPELPGDTNQDGLVDVQDVVAVISTWGPCPPTSCPADLNLDGVVDVLDLILVISAWGG